MTTSFFAPWGAGGYPPAPQGEPGIYTTSVDSNALDLFGSTQNLYTADRLGRGLELARMTRTHDKIKKIIDLTDTLIEQLSAKQGDAVCLRLLRVLRCHGTDNPLKYAKIAGNMGEELLQCESHFAEGYFEEQTLFCQAGNDNEGRNKAICQIAEAYLVRARKADSAMARSTWIENAIQKLRESGDQKERIKALQIELVSVQKNIMFEMQECSTGPMDFSKEAMRAISHVQGKDWPIAMLLFANIRSTLCVCDLKSLSKSIAEKCVMSYISSAKYVDSRGRTVARGASCFDDQDRALTEVMYMQASFARHKDVAGFIEPARQTIISEHVALPEDFMPFIKRNPYVSEGHEMVIAKGLSAGMHGDFIVAYHLLVPQLEDMLRMILLARGVLPINMDIESIQSDWSMGKALDNPELESEFGEDVVWMLKCLLTDKLGENGRNLMAHGLMHSNQFFSVQVVYFWWLFVHILFIPILETIRRSEKQKHDIETPPSSATPAE